MSPDETTCATGGSFIGYANKKLFDILNKIVPFHTAPVSPTVVNNWMSASPGAKSDPVQPDRSKVMFDEMAASGTDAGTVGDSSRGTGDGADMFASSTQKLRIISDTTRDLKVRSRSCVQMTCIC